MEFTIVDANHERRKTRIARKRAASPKWILDVMVWEWIRCRKHFLPRAMHLLTDKQFGEDKVDLAYFKNLFCCCKQINKANR